MADRNSAKVGESFTLDAKFTLDGAAVDVFVVKKVEIQDVDSNTLATLEATTHPEMGTYRVTVPALTQGGTLYDLWTYTAVEDADDSLLTNTVVVAEVEGEQGEDVEAADDTPDSGEDSVCQVTGTFLNASGNGVKGVHVRFTPIPLSDLTTEWGFVARDVDAQSDADGVVAMQLLRGLTGKLAISGIGLVREVTIPDADEVDIFDLVSGTPDLLEVQEPVFVPLVKVS